VVVVGCWGWGGSDGVVVVGWWWWGNGDGVVGTAAGEYDAT
jgi:hypothetical protein